MSQARSGSSKAVAAGILLLLTAATYYPTATLLFLQYDDPSYVTKNLHVQKGLSLTTIGWAFKSTDAANWHPLTWLSHILDYQLFGLSPAAAHVTNVLIHAANVLILFLLLHAATKALWRSAFVAALFCVHPLNVESVAWVAERKNVLSTLFLLLTIWAYFRYVAKGGWKRYLPVIVFFALGLMSKPMLVTVPFLLLLLDYWPLNRFSLESSQSKEEDAELTSMQGKLENSSVQTRLNFRRAWRLVAEKIPLFLLVIPSSIITIVAQKKGGAVSTLIVSPVSLRLENALVSYLTYIQKTVMPSRLAVFYPFPTVPPPFWQMALAAIVLISMTGLALVLARKYRYVPVGWLWYLGSLVPVIGILQVGAQSWADRYAYVPLIGLFILVCWGAADFASRYPKGGVIACVVGMTAVAAFTVATHIELGYWKDTITIFERANSVTQNNYVADENLGAEFLKVGRLDEAVPLLKRALRLDPNYAGGEFDLGLALAQQGNPNEAIPHLQKSVKMLPDAGEAYDNLGGVLLEVGRTQEAQGYLQKAVELEPDYPLVYANLASCLEQLGNLPEALANNQKALDLISKNQSARAREVNQDISAQLNYRMANILVQLGKPNDAAERYREALEIRPNFAEAKQRLERIQSPR